jgi:hypothetical protein
LTAGGGVGAGAGAAGDGGRVGVTWQPASAAVSDNTRAAAKSALGGRRSRVRPLESTAMWILLLEALLALGLFIFIVWWTMFSGRKKK